MNSGTSSIIWHNGIYNVGKHVINDEIGTMGEEDEYWVRWWVFWNGTITPYRTLMERFLNLEKL